MYGCQQVNIACQRGQKKGRSRADSRRHHRQGHPETVNNLADDQIAHCKTYHIHGKGQGRHRTAGHKFRFQSRHNSDDRPHTGIGKYRDNQRN